METMKNFPSEGPSACVAANLLFYKRSVGIIPPIPSPPVKAPQQETHTSIETPIRQYFTYSNVFALELISRLLERP
tara:strand:+ start:1049 stop:1276 length:228 start_codon:yes stop_codon:yes gene_type:complete